jgi:hypothetical protein
VVGRLVAHLLHGVCDSLQWLRVDARYSEVRRGGLQIHEPAAPSSRASSRLSLSRLLDWVASILVALALVPAWLLFLGPWAAVRSVIRWPRRIRAAQRWEQMRGHEAKLRVPRWLKVGAYALRKRLEKLGIHDSFAIQLVQEHCESLDGVPAAYYPHFSQFQEYRPVLRVTLSFVFGLQNYTEDGRKPETEVVQSAAYLLSHEYAHSVHELALTMVAFRDRGGRLPGMRHAERISSLLRSWRVGPRGRAEAFADDVAVFLCGSPPFFGWDDSAARPTAIRSRVRQVLSLHAQILEALDAASWTELRDYVQLRWPCLDRTRLVQTGQLAA